MDRRVFLQGLGCSVAASPWITPIALANGPWENRLIVIILRGAMDGLDVIRPVFDPHYLPLRPNLGQGGLPIGDWALHPGLEPLVPLWNAAEFGAVHAVSTPYRDKRSHFDGQDILEAGVSGLDSQRDRDGWLNRMIGLIPGAHAETAYAVGREHMLILEGSAMAASWSPDVELAISPQVERLIRLVHENDPLFEAASQDALRIASEVAGGRQVGGAEHLRIAEFTVQRLLADTRIASFSLGGWDTHGQQTGHINRALTRLSEIILALKSGLGPVWGQTAVVCMTEFGRTAHENGTRGTDHGTGGAMLYFGGALRGGQIISDWPGLGDLYQGRDLVSTRDIRAHAGWVIQDLFGLSTTDIEQVVFPGAELGPRSGILSGD